MYIHQLKKSPKIHLGSGFLVDSRVAKELGWLNHRILFVDMILW